jgi:hypothetical protein
MGGPRRVLSGLETDEMKLAGLDISSARTMERKRFWRKWMPERGCMETRAAEITSSEFEANKQVLN